MPPPVVPVAPAGTAADADTKDVFLVPPVPQQSLGGENPEASAPAEKGSDATVPTDMPGATPAPAVGMPLESLEVAPVPASTAADADTKDVPPVPPIFQQSLGGENPEASAPAEKGSDATVPTDMPGATPAPAVGMPLESLEVAPVPASTAADADTKDVPPVPSVFFSKA